MASWYVRRPASFGVTSNLTGDDLAFAAQFDPVFLLDRLHLRPVRHAGRSGRQPDFDANGRGMPFACR